MKYTIREYTGILCGCVAKVFIWLTDKIMGDCEDE